MLEQRLENKHRLKLLYFINDLANRVWKSAYVHHYSLMGCINNMLSFKTDRSKPQLTHSVHKTVMRCSISGAFFTENRIAVFTKDVQLYLISFYSTFITEFHCLSTE